MESVAEVKASRGSTELRVMSNQETSATIIVLKDHRTPPLEHSPCRVTFYGTVFNNDLEIQQSLRFQVILPDGNLQALLSDVGDAGGLFHQQDGVVWFLPWPVAAVRVETIGTPNTA